MIRVCSHQPSFLPWIGFWNKVVHSDLYIATCGVNFAKEDYQNRVKLADQWLTLPVRKETKNGPISLVKIVSGATQAAAKSLEKTICGKKYPHAYRIKPILEFLKDNTLEGLETVNLNTMRMIAETLGLKPHDTYQVVSHEEAPDPELSKTQNLVARVRGSMPGLPKGRITYMAGAGTASYLIDEHLDGMMVRVQRLKPEYAKDETILQLIAREDDPMSAVMFAADWVDLK